MSNDDVIVPRRREKPTHVVALEAFLAQHVVKKSETYNFQSISPPKTYFILPEEINSLFLLYSNVLSYTTYRPSLLEAQTENVPSLLQFDIDLTLDGTTIRKEYKDKQLRECSLIICTEIFKMFKLRGNKMRVYVFEKKPKLKHGRPYNGLHLITNIEMFVQYKRFIVSNIKHELSKVFEPCCAPDSFNNIIDDTIYLKAWFLYGSCYPTEEEAYELTTVFNARKFEDKSGKKIHIKRTKPVGNRGERAKLFRLNAGNKMPELVSEKLHNTVSKWYSEHCKKRDVQRIVVTSRPDKRVDIEYALGLLNIISEKRASQGSYTDWIRIGMALHSVCHCQELLDGWTNFSRKCPEAFSDGECEKIWDSWEGKSYSVTMGSLIYWARNDNPEKFIEFEKSNITTQLMTATQIRNYDVAKILSKVFGHTFIYEPYSKQWYYKPESSFCWQVSILDIPREISIYISETLVKTYEDFIRILCHCVKKKREEEERTKTKLKKRGKKPETDDEDSDDEGVEVDEEGDDLVTNKLARKFKGKTSRDVEYFIKTCDHNISSLKTRSFKDQSIKEASILMAREDFIKLADMNTTVIAFTDGVVTLTEDHKSKKLVCKFSSETQEIITKSCRFNCPIGPSAPVTKLEKAVKFLDREFYSKVYTNEDTKWYVLKILAKAMYGNVDQHMFFFIGGGSNGKTTVLVFAKETFGDYALEQPFSVIAYSHKASASQGPTPYSAELKAIRFYLISEMKKSVVIDMEFMKWMTGGGELVGRFCRQDPIRFTNQTITPFGDLNYPPRFSTFSSYGDIRRPIFVPHYSGFFDDEMCSDSTIVKHQLAKCTKTFKKERRFLTTIIKEPLMKQANMLLYLRALEKNAPVSREVSDYTISYMYSASAVVKFMDTCIVPIAEDDDMEPDESILTTNHLFEIFKTWYMNEYGGTTRSVVQITRGEFLEYVESHKFYNVEKKGILGHKLVNT
jgi:phage/plasmid-associated DNA primase